MCGPPLYPFDKLALSTDCRSQSKVTALFAIPVLGPGHARVPGNFGTRVYPDPGWTRNPDIPGPGTLGLNRVLIRF